jgi:subtilisin family serine protease
MKRTIAILASLALVLAALALPAGTGAAAGGTGFLIGSANPLTADQVSQLRAAGATVKHVYKNFGGASAVIPTAKVAAVRSLPFVTGVNEDPLRQLDSIRVEAAPQAVTADSPAPVAPYWLDLIDAEKNTTYDGSGVWVAVLDGGMFPNWRKFFKEESILAEHARAFEGASVVGSQNWDSGSDPHGMAVAATIVGYWLHDGEKEGGWGEGPVTGTAGTYWHPGVAEGAKIIPIQVCIPVGCFGSSINAAVDYVTGLKKANPDQPIVLNESLGGGGLDPVEQAAIEAAIKAGVVMVASAGNAGNAGMGFPGAYEPVISTAAGGWVDQWKTLPSKDWYQGGPDESIDEVFVADFSSRQLEGQYLDVTSTGRFMLLPYPCVNLYKDGQVVSRTNHKMCASKADASNPSAAPFQYLFMSGTSFSAPTVSGIVALMLDKNPTLSNANATFGTFDDPDSWKPGSLELLLESAATPIAPGEVVVTHRTGVPDTECWEMPSCALKATGAGWVYVDDALAAVPSP